MPIITTLSINLLELLYCREHFLMEENNRRERINHPKNTEIYFCNTLYI